MILLQVHLSMIHFEWSTTWKNFEWCPLFNFGCCLEPTLEIIIWWYYESPLSCHYVISTTSVTCHSNQFTKPGHISSWFMNPPGFVPRKDTKRTNVQTHFITQIVVPKIGDLSTYGHCILTSFPTCYLAQSCPKSSWLYLLALYH